MPSDIETAPMTLSDEMRGLIERIERATGPDRELDCRIWCAIRGGPDFDLCAAVVPDFGQWQAPSYTASIDAAMTLVPEGVRIILNVSEDGITTAIVDGTQGCAATPALALCAAALKALSTIEGHGDG